MVYPPVSIEHYTPGPGTGNYFLTVSALVPYKRVDLAVRTCKRLGVRLVVVGDGPERARLQKMGGDKTEFIGWQTQEELTELYRNASALLYPGEEDFGIAPVEAQACGRPVIAYGFGGALDTVVPSGNDQTGIYFYEQTPESLSQAMKQLDSVPFDTGAIRRHAEQFSRQRFRQEMYDVIYDAWNRMQG